MYLSHFPDNFLSRAKCSRCVSKKSCKSSDGSFGKPLDSSSRSSSSSKSSNSSSKNLTVASPKGVDEVLVIPSKRSEIDRQSKSTNPF